MSAVTGKLFYGDNLDVMRRYQSSHFTDESVNLVYLDPPFNSNRSYNVLFRSKTGEDAQAQIEAFDDTWEWSTEVEEAYEELTDSGQTPHRVASAIAALRQILGANDVLAYLVMMTPRLLELHRILRHDGSLYLHCDPTASHYLKMILDTIFGPRCFRNEIIWRRTGAHGKVKRFAPTHDVILFYTKTDSDQFKWNGSTKPYMMGHVRDFFVEDGDGWRTNYYGNVLTGSGTRGGESGQVWRGFDPTAKGRHWAIPGAIVADSGIDMTALSQHEKLDKLYELGYITIDPGAAWPIYQRRIQPGDGTPAPDIWAFQPYTDGTVFGTNRGVDADVRWLNPKDRERLGYPTQKPLGLLERIIKASTDPGDVVFDPFCGCGTTVDAAEKLGRKWVGIDITYLSIDLIRDRLKTTHGEAITDRISIYGVPRDLQGASALFQQSAFEFERWAVSLVGGRPNQKQVGDRGMDGVIRFLSGKKKVNGRVLVSVKGGRSPNPAWVRDLLGTVETEKAEMGVLILSAKPTRGVLSAAEGAGLYEWPGNNNKFPRIQVVTIEELLKGGRLALPPILSPYMEAKRAAPQVDQIELALQSDVSPEGAVAE